VKIQASCKQSLFQLFQRHCRVGEWKVITNFSLSPVCGLYRHTNHVYKIEFMSQTLITDSNLHCDNMFLELKQFDNIKNGSHDTIFLIDVIGEVLDFGGLDIIQCARKEVTKMEFTLRDIKFHVDGNSLDMYQSKHDNVRIQEKRHKWYKLELLVQDQTGETKISLLDSVAKSIVKTSAAKVVNVLLDEVEDPELLPACITDLVGKTYKFGVTIEKGAEIFKVLKVWSVYNTLMVDSQSETALERETIAISGSEVSQLTYSDESSSKMITPSKRTVDDIFDIPDNTSTSKIRHVKSIKVEKMTSEELSLKKN
ncbi:unnamed protein product, partial [Brassica rapa]